MRDLDEVFAALERSPFRRRQVLNDKDRRYLQQRGLETVLQHAADFVAQRLAPAQPANDGRQTPWRGHPVFTAQHATATCCRGCLAKWHATEHAVQSALDAIQVHGANGYSDEFPVERYLRNSKAAVIYEGTSQLHTLIQADYALGYREDRPLRCEPWPADGWERPTV